MKIKWNYIGIERTCKVAKSKFYQAFLDCCCLIKNHQPSNRNEILNKYILYNTFIKRGDKCLDSTVLIDKEAHMKLKLADIVYLNGNMLDHEDLRKAEPLSAAKMANNHLINHSTEDVQLNRYHFV